jgi:hypothetical protein
MVNTKESKMAVATIKLVNEQCMGDFYFRKDQEATARSLLKSGQYRVQGTMGLPGLEGEEAAEQVFDLTNNPYRQDERELLYGRHRSVSVGDIVNVDGVDFLCASMGWQRL